MSRDIIEAAKNLIVKLSKEEKDKDILEKIRYDICTVKSKSLPRSRPFLAGVAPSPPINNIAKIYQILFLNQNVKYGLKLLYLYFPNVEKN